MNRIDVVRAAIAATGADTYLEVGVKDGDCFDAVNVATKVAVDPAFAFRPPVRARLRKALGATTGSLYFATTSDAFFRTAARRLGPFGVVFVDGLHTYEQSYRDIQHALAALADGGVVVVHDCNPTSPAAAAPTLEAAARTPGFVGDWNGDVYKSIVRLRTRDDVCASVLDCDQGVGIVTRGSPASPLTLSDTDVAALSYAELDADRVRLLGLRPADELAEALAGG